VQSLIATRAAEGGVEIRTVVVDPPGVSTVHICGLAVLVGIVIWATLQFSRAPATEVVGPERAAPTAAHNGDIREVAERGGVEVADNPVRRRIKTKTSPLAHLAVDPNSW